MLSTDAAAAVDDDDDVRMLTKTMTKTLLVNSRTKSQLESIVSKLPLCTQITFLLIHTGIILTRKEINFNLQTKLDILTFVSRACR